MANRDTDTDQGLGSVIRRKKVGFGALTRFGSIRYRKALCPVGPERDAGWSSW